MNKSEENGRDATRDDQPGGRGADANHQARRTDEPTVGLETALESGLVELKDIVRLLACRMSRAESHVASQKDQSSKHEESIRMICTVLKDLDDPYGFGVSLDERLAYDGDD
jgi:hypothetical protein